MNNFDYVMHENHICVLINQNETFSTIAGVNLIGSRDSYFAYEIDVPNDHVSECNIEISEQSIIHRLRLWRMTHRYVFGFLDQELTLIHPFI